MASLAFCEHHGGDRRRALGWMFTNGCSRASLAAWHGLGRGRGHVADDAASGAVGGSRSRSGRFGLLHNVRVCEAEFGFEMP